MDRVKLDQLLTHFTLHNYEKEQEEIIACFSDLAEKKSTPHDLFEYVAAPSVQRRGGIIDDVRRATGAPGGTPEKKKTHDIYDDLAKRLVKSPLHKEGGNDCPLHKEGGKFEPTLAKTFGLGTPAAASEAAAARAAGAAAAARAAGTAAAAAAATATTAAGGDGTISNRPRKQRSCSAPGSLPVG